MAVHLLYLILITITTTITNYSCGELFLQMPLTINPVVQDIVTERSILLTRFYTLDPDYYSRITAAHMVVKLNNTLQFVMKKTVRGAIVLGAAAKMAGLTVHQLHNTNAYSKWFVNISLSEIKGILNKNEEQLVPLSDEMKIDALQTLGVRALQRRYNVTLPSTIADRLHSSTATTLSAIAEDWIGVVRYIAKSRVDRLAARYGVAVFTLAQALQFTTGELYRITLAQLDQVLATNFTFSDGMMQVVSTTMKTATVPETTPVSSAQFPPEITTTPPPKDPTSETITTLSESGKTLPVFYTTTQLYRPYEDSSTSETAPSQDGSTGKKDDTNQILFIGIGVVGSLLVVVVITCTWYLKTRKGRSRDNVKKKQPDDNNITKMKNFWVEKNDNEPGQDELVYDTRHPAAGVDYRSKGVTYVPTQSTFERQTNVRTSIYEYDVDTRKEIFV